MGNVVNFNLCSNEKVREEVAKYPDYDSIGESVPL